MIRFVRKIRFLSVKVVRHRTAAIPRTQNNFMKRWAWIVAALYVALLLALTIPAVVLAFPTAKVSEALSAFGWPPYWIWLAILFLSQWALLSVPVRMASLRPITRGPVWRTILAGGLMGGFLVAGAFLSFYEFVMHQMDGYGLWIAVGVGGLAWGLWTLVFVLAGRSQPNDLVSYQCKYLFRGSVLELLIAVPTHVVVRHRNYCCAGYSTFIGLTAGVSVMLFAFGPAVFFLFAQRWKRLHPKRP